MAGLFQSLSKDNKQSGGGLFGQINKQEEQRKEAQTKALNDKFVDSMFRLVDDPPFPNMPAELKMPKATSSSGYKPSQSTVANRAALANKAIAPAKTADQVQAERKAQAQTQRAEQGKWFDENGLGWLRQNVLDPYANFMDYLRFDTSEGQALDRVGHTASSIAGPAIGQKPTTGNKTVDFIADLVGGVGGFISNPSQIESNLMTGGYNAANSFLAHKSGQWLTNAAQKGATKAANVVNPLLNTQGINLGKNLTDKLTEAALRGAGANAIQNTVQGMNRGETDAQEIGFNALTGAVLGGAGDAAFSGLGSAVNNLFKRTGNQAVESAAVDALTPTMKGQQVKAIDEVAPSVGELETSTGNTVPNGVQSQERGLFSTLRNSEKINNEVAAGLETSASRAYEPITNADTVAKANARIVNNIDAAESFALGSNGTKPLDAEQVATGFRLIDEFQKSGQIDKAVNMAEQLAERLTKAGQSIQAASIWNRLTPEGALLAAQRIVNRTNESLSRFSKEVKISDKQANDIMNTAAAIQRSGASKERAANVMDILDRIRAGEEVSISEKQAITDFIQDAKQFVQPKRQAQPRPAKQPTEFQDKRIRDKVVSFLDAQEQAARERLRARGNTANSLPLDVWADYAIIGAAKLGKGAVKFSDWSEQMAKDLGEEIRPHLAEIYERSKDMLSSNAKRIKEDTISNAERVADGYLRKNAGKLSNEDIDIVRNLAQKVSSLSGDAKRAASQDLQYILNNFERAGIGKKLSATQYIFMLLNPLTQIKNVAGNELMYRLERLARTAATPIDWSYSKITGNDRTITFRGGPASWENFFAPSKDYFKGLIEGGKAGWRGINPEGLTTAYDINGQAFKGKLNPLTYLEKTLGAVMKGFDYAAYSRAANQRLREMAHLDAINKGVKGSDNIQRHIDRYLTNTEDNIEAIAKEYGKYVTLQDDTLLSRALQSTKRGINKLSTAGLSSNFGLGNFVLPFAKTPANLLMRAIDYSPAGFVRTITQAADIIRNPNTQLTRADIMQSLTRALFGTGLSGAGLWLADKGVLRGESSKDKDVRELEKSAGLGQYQLNASALQRMLEAIVTGNMDDIDKAAKIQPGDTLYQYEWAQPTSIPLAIGANISQSKKQNDRQIAKGENPTNSVLDIIGNAASGGLNTLYNTSVLQGLQRAFDLPPGEDNIIKAIGTNVAKQVPSMFTPSFLNRTNMLMDPNVRETYSPDFVQSLLNQSTSRIPWAAERLPQKVNTLGQPVTRENSFADVFLSPAPRSEFKPSKEAQLIIDLMNETGDDALAPRAVPKYITGKEKGSKESTRVDLTGPQYVQYQTIVGQETQKLLSKINDNWSTERKVKAVMDALNKANEVGRQKMRKELGLKVK